MTTCAVALLLAVATGAAKASEPDPARIKQIIERFVEANRYWLLGPPPNVRNFSYTLNRIGGTQEFEVSEPTEAPQARRQGVSYFTLVHQLARAPQTAMVRDVVEEQGRMRLVLEFDAGLRWICGNGVEGSWNGYFSMAAPEGFLVLDTERWVPLEAQAGRLHETFGEFVRLDGQHYVPLAIQIDREDTHYEWRFRLYEPGLWLFDEGRSEGRRLAWIEKVKVNAASAQVRNATAASLKRAEQEAAGQARLQEFLKANLHWLLPPSVGHRSLVYEYRQEAPYLERILSDADGNLLAQLAASKESPEQPMRQALWLADGRSYRGDARDRFVSLQRAPDTASGPDAWLRRDRLPQHLAMGLALDCALTRLAREPESFWAEVRDVSDQKERYWLVLHAKRDTRLFTGTMLAFTSSCYMHDVTYDHSEVLCETGTHRPLEESDYAGESNLKGHYWFEDWIENPSGAVPGRIRAMVPYERDGKDQSLEMNAAFHQPKPNLWLLDKVESHFRSGGGSTGTLAVVAATADSFRPISELLEKANLTEQTLASIAQAPSTREQKIRSGEWLDFPLNASWTAKALDSARAGEEKQQPAPLIGLHQAKVVLTARGAWQLELEGVSTASWKQFEAEFKAALMDGEGRLLSSVTTNLDVRAEGAPTPFALNLLIPLATNAPSPKWLGLEGTVQRMTGVYHGHGLWMQFMKDQ